MFLIIFSADFWCYYINIFELKSDLDSIITIRSFLSMFPPSKSDRRIYLFAAFLLATVAEVIGVRI